MLFVPVCRSRSRKQPTVPLFPFHLLISAGVLLVDLNLGIFTKGNLPLRYISPSTWGNQQRARSRYHLSRIKQISGAVDGDSNLQDRGVSHYLLSLLFSLVSLPFSFYLSVLYQKSHFF